MSRDYTCPTCAMHLDAHVGMEDGSPPPGPGDVLLCLHCTQVMVLRLSGPEAVELSDLIETEYITAIQALELILGAAMVRLGDEPPPEPSSGPAGGQ